MISDEWTLSILEIWETLSDMNPLVSGSSNRAIWKEKNLASLVCLSIVFFLISIYSFF